MSMTKNALLAPIAYETGDDKDDIRLHIDMFLTSIGRALAKGKTVKIKGFGTLSMTNDGAVAFQAVPSLVRSASLEEVIDDVARDVAHDLQVKLHTRTGNAGTLGM